MLSFGGDITIFPFFYSVFPEAKYIVCRLFPSLVRFPVDRLEIRVEEMSLIVW